jgi:hypothetical protein
MKDPFTGPMSALGSETRLPGQYKLSKDNEADEKEIARDTREMMHPSVRVRRQHLGPKALKLWDPPSLTGFTLRAGSKDSTPWAWAGREGSKEPMRKAWEWVKPVPGKGEVVIPEYRMTGKWERRLAEACPTKGFDAGSTPNIWADIAREP